MKYMAALFTPVVKKEDTEDGDFYDLYCDEIYNILKYDFE